MSEEQNEEEIDFASEDSPILTREEPNFRRFFARGSVLQVEDYDNETVQLGFWNSKEEGIQLEGDSETTATGYSLEAEAVMTWSTLTKLHRLLESYIEENAPEEHQIESK